MAATNFWKQRWAVNRLLVAVPLLAIGAMGKTQDYVGLFEKEAQSRIKTETRYRKEKKRSPWQSSNEQKIVATPVAATVELRLLFDSTGQCYAEEYWCKDEPTAQQWLNKTLNKKTYGWRALNENQHVSSIDRQRLLEIYTHEKYWIVQVLRTNWSSLQYQLLFSNDNNIK